MEELKSLLNIQESELEVQDWLGGGGTSAVFKGVWFYNGERVDVAIKKIKLLNEDAIREICKEFKVMVGLPFEHICKLYGGCAMDSRGEAWLVMEYADGGNLHNFIQKHNGPLSTDLQLSLLIQATKALATLHNASSPILHREITSLNYLVQTKNNNVKLLLSGFGLSQALRMTPNTETFTVGTLRWVAPEILLMKKKYWSAKTDIFSLGMVFYEILAGDFPYNDVCDLYQILDKIKHSILPQLPAECPKDLASIIQRCWSFKAERRPSTTELLVLWSDVDFSDNKGPPRVADLAQKKSMLQKITFTSSPNLIKKTSPTPKSARSFSPERVRGMLHIGEPKKIDRRQRSFSDVRPVSQPPVRSERAPSLLHRSFSVDTPEFEKTVRGSKGIGSFLSRKIFKGKKDKQKVAESVNNANETSRSTSNKEDEVQDEIQ